MEKAGVELDSYRSRLMLSRNLGLTALYSLVHDPGCHDDEIRRLREIHLEVDEAVKAAYAADEKADQGIRAWEELETREPGALPTWRDFDLDHGFHETRQGVRFTIGPQARVDVLDKLLSLNHYRWDQEERQGLHRKKTTKGRKTAPSAVSAPPRATDPEDGALFEPPDTLF